MEHRIQGAYTALDMGALYPSLAPLPQSVSGNATRHKEKAYGRVLKTRVSEVWRQTKQKWAEWESNPNEADPLPARCGFPHPNWYHVERTLEGTSAASRTSIFCHGMVILVLT